MIGSAIRELAAARTVPRICAAFVERTIQVWDLVTQRLIAEFPARYSFGAENLAIDPSGEFAATGLSAKTGKIAGYTLPSGAEVWRRDRITYPDSLRFDPWGRSLLWTVNNRTVERVDPRTGTTIEVLKNIAHRFEGPNGRALTVPTSGPSYVVSGEHEVAIPKLTFAVLDVAFAVDRLCLTESGGPMRCFGYHVGSECWRYTPPTGSHVLRVHHNRVDGFFYGVLWHFETGNFRRLIRFDPERGTVSDIHDLPSSSNEAFSEATQQLVTSAGEVIDLARGEIVGKLEFPRKEYPDEMILP